MIYDWQNGMVNGEPMCPPCGRLYNAETGVEIDEAVYWLNTDIGFAGLGEYKYHRENKNGSLMLGPNGNFVSVHVKGVKLKFVSDESSR